MGGNATRLIAVRLTPPVKMEVMQKPIRLRKALLDPNARKRAFHAKESG